MHEFDYFNWIVLPFLIFISRMGDVTLATLRHLFVSKGFKKIVPFIGFFEVLIWLVAMRQVFNNLNNMACFIAWAGGFATGTYLGMLIEEKLALGMQLLRVITDKDAVVLINEFKKLNQGVTIVDAEGTQGKVKMIFTIFKRINKQEIIKIVEQHSKDAFYTIEDVRGSSHGVFSDKSKGFILKRFFK